MVSVICGPNLSSRTLVGEGKRGGGGRLLGHLRLQLVVCCYGFMFIAAARTNADGLKNEPPARPFEEGAEEVKAKTPLRKVLNL